MNDVRSYLMGLSGGEILLAEPGYGSFITLDIKSSTAPWHKITVWVYLSSWALTRHGTEVAASGYSNQRFASSKHEICKLTSQMVKQVQIVDFDELHFHFTGSHTLEIWEDVTKYDAGSAMIKLFEDGKYVFSVTAPLT